LVNQVLHWTMTHLWSRRDYFYYQQHPWGTNRIPYMRWSQAWMLLALVTLVEAQQAKAEDGTLPASSASSAGAGDVVASARIA